MDGVGRFTRKKLEAHFPFPATAVRHSRCGRANVSNDRRYPVSVTGALEQPLSRWLFLVKWLLLIPHFIILAVLLVGAAVAIIAALFAITFTGKYPRGLFDYNVGVLRWAWLS